MLLNKAKEHNRVYKNPDLLLKIILDEKVYYQPMEVKSTKDNKIPGSSVQQALPNDPVVFIKHTNNDIEITTGLYVNAITGTMQFPDRSPRPQVGYSTLKTWNEKNRMVENGCLFFENDDDREEREQLFIDWQNVLSDRWINVLKSDSKEKKEPWFNNNLRKFVVKLLEEYDQMNLEKKKEYIDKIKKNIKDDIE